MNVLVDDAKRLAVPGASRLAVADCDIHPSAKSPDYLHRWLSKRWIDHLNQFGITTRNGWRVGPVYPNGQPNAARRDAVPPEGGRPGSSLPFMQTQLLDTNNVRFGILNPSRSGQGGQNLDLVTALCSANNDWQIEDWTSKESRLRGSVVVNYEDAPAAAAEIRKRAGDKNFAQVLLLLRTADPLGAKRYWPIYEAAVEAGLPVGIHAFGYGGGPSSGGGWPSYYIEEMVGHAAAGQAVAASFVLDGALERFPDLKIVMIEAGFAWAAPLAWRLDKVFHRLHAETPYLKKLPSEYLRTQMWWTSQPMEEPQPFEHVLDSIEWMGWDRLMFATDYPHWDYDDPATCLPLKITPEQRHAFFLGNASHVYGIPV